MGEKRKHADPGKQKPPEPRLAPKPREPKELAPKPKEAAKPPRIPAAAQQGARVKAATKPPQQGGYDAQGRWRDAEGNVLEILGS